MNYFLGILAIIAATFTAYVFSGKYTLKKKFYRDMKSFNDRLKGEVSFSKNTIIAIISESRGDSDFYKLLNNRFKGGKEVVDLKYLKSGEADEVINYLNDVGRADAVTELGVVSKAETKINENYEKAVSDEKKYKTLYLKLGFLVGLAVFVMLL